VSAVFLMLGFDGGGGIRLMQPIITSIGS